MWHVSVGDTETDCVPAAKIAKSEHTEHIASQQTREERSAPWAVTNNNVCGMASCYYFVAELCSVGGWKWHDFSIVVTSFITAAG